MSSVPIPATPAAQEILTENDLATLLGRSRRTVRRYAVCGLIPYSKLGGTTVFRRSAVLQRLAEMEAGR